jgi:Rab5 GDP/GTP exchange factor
MGAVQFIENMDRTTLTISDDEFERNVEAAVSAIAEKHRVESPPPEPPISEKSPTALHPQSGTSSRRSFEAGSGDPSTPRRSTSSNEGVDPAVEDNAAIVGLLRSIQRPLSTIGRMFSDEPTQASSGPSSAPRTPAPPDRTSPRPADEPPGSGTSATNARHQLSAEEAAARQASAEAAEAQRLHRAEHANIVETLAGMFPDLDREIISDVVYQKEGR